MIHRYEKIVNCSEQESIGELILWWKYVSQMNENTKNSHSALHIVYDETIFPIVRKLLDILDTLPVTRRPPPKGLIRFSGVSKPICKIQPEDHA